MTERWTSSPLTGKAESKTAGPGTAGLLGKVQPTFPPTSKPGSAVPMRRVILESPFAGNVLQRWLNRRYARACMRDALLRGEAPIASHLLYTQPGVLHDGDPHERAWGIEAGLAWGSVADATVVYIDRGISSGMQRGIENAQAAGRPIERRTLRPQ